MVEHFRKVYEINRIAKFVSSAPLYNHKIYSIFMAMFICHANSNIFLITDDRKPESVQTYYYGVVRHVNSNHYVSNTL